VLNTAPDLCFKPANPSTLKRLTRAQVDHYNRQGFVQPFTVFGPERIAQTRAYVDGLTGAMGEAGAYGVNCYQARLAGLLGTSPLTR